MLNGTESLEPINVLLVDDDPMVLRLHETMLNKFANSVIAFSSPNQALEYISKKRDQLDLVITDFRMPSMTGAELLQQIRDMGIRIPVLILTGFPDDVDFEMARHHEASVLTKPVRMNVLHSAIRAMNTPFRNVTG